MSWTRVGIALAAATLATVRAAADDVAIRPLDELGRVEVSAACPERWRDVAEGRELPEAEAAAVLALGLVDEATGRAGPPVLGRWVREGPRLVLRPRFPLAAGALYRARFVTPTGEVRTVEYRAAADSERPSTRVLGVYPTTPRVPANLLKFYLRFSAPMREGREVLERIRLVDDAGAEVPAPWRMTELWNADATRLALGIHPGRIKQGVSLREVEGPVLQAGRRYTLIVPCTLRDAAGRPLVEEFRHDFEVGPEDHALPRIDTWRVAPPTAGSRAPLVIEFGEPLDPYLAARCLVVIDARGAAVEGTVAIGDGESSWRFTPRGPWRGETYWVVVDDVLEDLAGNTPRRPFDLDTAAGDAGPPAGADAAAPREPLALEFTPR